jgi:hypothetical protein
MHARIAHTFYIVVKASQISYLVSGPLTLNVICDSLSATLTESTFSKTQVAEVGSATAGFIFGDYSSNTGCLPESYTIKWISQNG